MSLILGPQCLVSLVTPSSVGSACCDVPVCHYSDREAADRQVHQTSGSLSEEEHVDQQLNQVGLSNDGPEEEFADEAGRDALQQGGRQKDPGEALLVAGVEDLHHLAEGMLRFLLKALHKQSGLQVWNICPKRRHWSHTHILTHCR